MYRINDGNHIINWAGMSKHAFRKWGRMRVRRSEASHSSGSEEVLNKWDQNQTVTTNAGRDTT